MTNQLARLINLQVASYDLLKSLMPMSVEPAVMEVRGVNVTVDIS